MAKKETTEPIFDSMIAVGQKQKKKQKKIQGKKILDDAVAVAAAGAVASGSASQKAGPP